jgi:sec-independent protein translocase protein TatB
MLDVGFSEILLTSAIALIVLGPERLPKVARQVGNWMGRARAMARQLTEQLEREVNAEELLKTQSKPIPGSAHESPPPAIAPPSIAPPATAPPPAVPGEVAAAPVSAPEPTYGLDAALTTPAAMHASDPPSGTKTSP